MHCPPQRQRAGAAAVVIGLLLAVAAPPTRATELESEASDSGTSDSPRINALLEQGRRLRRQGRDERALEVLQRARTLAPDSTRVQAHLASAHQALGDWVAAEAVLSRVLVRTTDPYVQRNRPLLEQALQAVGDHVGSIEVIATPPGAQLRVDGRPLGTLPLTEPVKLEAGAHVVEVQAADHFTISRSVRVRAGVVTRESIELPPRLAPAAPRPDAIQTPESPLPENTHTAHDAVPWVLAGAGAAALVSTAVAWALRESHASTWASGECLVFGQTREQLCSADRDAAQRYEAWAIGSGITATLLGTGAVVSWWLSGESPTTETGSTAASCGLGLAAVVCNGTF